MDVPAENRGERRFRNARQGAFQSEESFRYFFTGFGVAFTSGFAAGFGAGATGFLTSTFFSIKKPPFSLMIGFLKYNFKSSNVLGKNGCDRGGFHPLISLYIGPKKTQGESLGF
jgi:hypothetical protein